MHEFHRGGRRTYGAATLLVACVLLIGWMRSAVLSEEFVLESRCSRVCSETYLIRSHDNAIRFIYRAWSKSVGGREEEEFTLPYVMIIMPLALTSLALILWKPRAEPSPK